MADKENVKTAQPFSEEPRDNASSKADDKPSRPDMADEPNADAEKVTTRQE